MKKNSSVNNFSPQVRVPQFELGDKQNASFYPLAYDGIDKFATDTKCHVCGNPLYQRDKKCYPFLNKRDTVLPTFQWHCGYSTIYLSN